MECAKCGAPGEWTKLHDVITGEGIVKLCKKCIAEENAPVIHKPTEKEIQSITKSESLYKRLSDAAGIDPVEHRRNIQEFHKQDLIKKEEVTLRDLVDKKFDRFVKKTLKKREDLIDNFHWVIMRARRIKKKSVLQLAKEIGESERVIKMAEQGVLPEGDYRIVEKLENALGIRILKPEIAEELERQRKQLGFDKYSTENLTVSDLQEMKKEGTYENKEPYWRRFLFSLIGKKETTEEVLEEQEEPKHVDFEESHEVPIEFDDTSLEIEEELPERSEEESDRDVSQKDIDDIIFGRK